MAYIPLMFDFTNKIIKIFGGGMIAERRVKALLESEAIIQIISPNITSRLKELHNSNRIHWINKEFDSGDIKNADFIIVATGNEAVNQKILKLTPDHTLINMTNEAESGNVIFPGTLNRGKLSISVSSNGASPKLVTQILNNLNEQFPPDYEAYVDFLYHCRCTIKNLEIEKEQKQQLLEEIISDKYLDSNHQLQFTKWLDTQNSMRAREE